MPYFSKPISQVTLGMLLSALVTLLNTQMAAGAQGAGATDEKNTKFCQTEEGIREIANARNTIDESSESGASDTSDQAKAKAKACNFLSACGQTHPKCPDLATTRQECRQLQKERNEASKKKIEACKSIRASATKKVDKLDEDGDETGIETTECEARVEKCNSIDSSEAEFDFTTQMMTSLTGMQMPGQQYTDSCKPLTPEDARSLRTKEDRLKERVEKLEKELTEIQEDSEKQKRAIERDIQELNKQAREEDLQRKEQERQDVAQNQQAQIEAQRKLREIQRNILAMQTASSKLVAERARTLARLSAATVKRNCIESIQAEINKLRSENPNIRRRQNKSANSLIAKNSTAQQSAQEKLRQCVREAQQLREETRIDFQGKSEDLQLQVDAAVKESNEIQSALQLMDSQRAEAQAEQQQNKVQIMQERIQKLQAFQKEMMSNAELTQLRILQNQKQLKQAQTDLSKASNELATVDKRPDGKFDLSEPLYYQEEMARLDGEMKSLNCSGKGGDPTEAPAAQ